mmetsp:Transcript_26465/g.75880  ORF Transcript_26465/g.75880 Transcript_26465/m.75880 type:complete len:766 (+) Transcript_26465:605-2902(+)
MTHTIRAVAPGDARWPADYSVGDMRYNTITWGAALDRIFAIGPSVIDPRSGEILKSDIFFTEGWIKSFINQFERRYPQIYTQEEEGDDRQQSSSIVEHFISSMPNADSDALRGLLSNAQLTDRELIEGFLRAHSNTENTDARGTRYTKHAVPGLHERMAHEARDGSFVALKLMYHQHMKDEESRRQLQRKSGNVTNVVRDAATSSHAWMPNDQRTLQGGNSTTDDGVDGAGWPSGSWSWYERILEAGLEDVVTHEVGHTLGLRHNFKASTTIPWEQLTNATYICKHGLGSSVMDYTAVNMAAGVADDALYFSPTIGDYDKLAIRFGYRRLEDEVSGVPHPSSLSLLSSEPMAFATDEDDPDASGTDPYNNVRDLSNPLQFYLNELEYVKNIRSVLLESSVLPGEDMSRLAEAEMTILGRVMTAGMYLSKFLGGVVLTKDPKPTPTQANEMMAEATAAMAPPALAVDGNRQQEALEAITEILTGVPARDDRRGKGSRGKRKSGVDGRGSSLYPSPESVQYLVRRVGVCSGPTRFCMGREPLDILASIDSLQKLLLLFIFLPRRLVRLRTLSWLSADYGSGSRASSPPLATAPPPATIQPGTLEQPDEQPMVTHTGGNETFSADYMTTDERRELRGRGGNDRESPFTTSRLVKELGSSLWPEFPSRGGAASVGREPLAFRAVRSPQRWSLQIFWIELMGALADGLLPIQELRASATTELWRIQAVLTSLKDDKRLMSGPLADLPSHLRLCEQTLDETLDPLRRGRGR